jgi:hypothetical protein
MWPDKRTNAAPNRFALTNTPRTWGTPSTTCRICTHPAGSASAKAGAIRASTRSNDRPIRRLLHPAVRRGVASDGVRRVACHLANRAHHVSHKYSVVKLPQDVLQIWKCVFQNYGEQRRYCNELWWQESITSAIVACGWNELTAVWVWISVCSFVRLFLCLFVA